jgi:hypothetical protein
LYRGTGTAEIRETRNLSFDKAVIRQMSVSFCLAPGLIIPLWIMTNGPLQRIEA